MKKILFTGFIVLSLLGCSESKKQNPGDGATHSSGQVEIGDGFGVFKKNSSSMPVNDIHAVWAEDTKELVIYQTPTKITSDERSRLNKGESEFFVFSDKKSPDESKWQWYPYVVTKLRFGTSEVKSANIESFYIMAYGIEEKNYTDNLNSYPGDKEKFNHVSFNNGKLSIDYFGVSSIMESSFSWNVKIK